MEVTKSKEPKEPKERKEKQEPELDSAIIDELKGYQQPEDMAGPGGILEVISAVRPTRPTV